MMMLAAIWWMFQAPFPDVFDLWHRASVIGRVRSDGYWRLWRADRADVDSA